MYYKIDYGSNFFASKQKIAIYTAKNWRFIILIIKGKIQILF